MSLGSFGIAKCGDLRKLVMGFTALLAILVTLLIITAMAGWSTNSSTLKQVAWGKYQISGLSLTS